MAQDEEDMPVIPPEEGEIERSSLYNRMNPKGYKELVVKSKRGVPKQATLNELADELLHILDDIQ